MKIVYSYAGKKPSDFTLKMAKLSLKTLSLFTEFPAVLYVDYQNLEYFRHLGYSEIIVQELDADLYNKGCWNIFKLKTYAHQTLPFLHVDFDTTFCEGFQLNKSDVITEKFRSVSKEEFKTFSIGESIEQMVCSGFIGGYNFGTLFKEHYEWAKQQVRDFEGSLTYEHLNSLEEYALTQRILKHNLSVSELKQGSFLHFWCENDKNKEEVHGQIVNSLFDVFNL